MGDSTPLSLPPDLPYPITLTRLLVTPGVSVSRGSRLAEYKFLSATRRKENDAKERAGKPVTAKEREDDMVGSWESPIDGEVTAWEAGVKVGLRIDQRQARKPLLHVEQPCTHPVQIHGMCGVCGKDLTNDDYMSRPPPSNNPGPSRYPGSFELAHDSLGVTVSTKEAKRLETLTRDTLLAARRLTLIVDLDQTIIHTTVDPTVGEWMNEIEEDERQAKEASKPDEEAAESTTPPNSPPAAAKELPRPVNPNAEALSDVARFQLADDLPPGMRSRQRGPEPVRWYYTKPRPGLKPFLDKMSKLYEMHVYTMGTRTYADAICKVVDPDGKIFGGRVLSRDESGSMSSKNLTRLFPTDQSMVVVIDDREDVWDGCPNVVKVVPYDFFVGIGDINGAFLPPTQPSITPIPSSKAPASPSSTVASSPPPETPPEIPSTEEGLLAQSKILDDLAKERPLAKLEEEGEKAESEAGGDASEDAVSGDVKPEDSTEAPAEPSSEPSAAPTPPNRTHLHHRKALFNNNDYELGRIEKILRQIHTGFYEAYAERDPSSSAMPLQCDTPLLIQEIKDKVLEGCVIAFTGVIPRHVQPERSEIWQAAESFGAVCTHDLNDKVTHLVTASLGTEKMHRAARFPKLKTVWLAWLQTCIALWKRLDETDYIAFHPTSASTSAAPSRPETPTVRKPAGGEADGSDAKDTRPHGDHGVGVSDAELIEDAAELDAAWDDDAQAEFEAFLNDGTDSEMGTDAGDDEREDEAESRASSVGSGDESAPPSPRRSSMRNSPASSRASTPGLKHMRFADEENLPLKVYHNLAESSYPPKKKRKLFMLESPRPEIDVPEENKFEYKGKEVVEGDGDETGGETDGEDEFAKMLEESLGDE
ncbi:CTD phosphatase Fcp1 [Vanrija albida]|uniref:RNA polymerase II subunit A C-terminal domain phosphatase n=1 Tax=Vanrija albida TaxID=181172 RepID=A0ABR3QBP1_9TREE